MFQCSLGNLLVSLLESRDRSHAVKGPRSVWAHRILSGTVPQLFTTTPAHDGNSNSSWWSPTRPSNCLPPKATRPSPIHVYPPSTHSPSTHPSTRTRTHRQRQEVVREHREDCARPHRRHCGASFPSLAAAARSPSRQKAKNLLPVAALVFPAFQLRLLA